MKISIENIEELIFDYHEGNLDESQKAGLLNLIHQHPEYERDFALWAQTYAHVQTNVPDYGLSALLLRKPVIAWYAQSWFQVFVASIVSVSFVAGFIFLTPNSVVERNTIPLVPIVQPEIQPATIFSAKITKTETIKIPDNRQKEIKTEPTIPVTKVAVTQGKIVETVNSISDSIATKEIPLEISKMEIIKAKPDTSLQQLSPALKVKEEKVMKKTHKKLTLNLKPSPDFLPVNPNF